MAYADEVKKFHFMADVGIILRKKLSEAQKEYENWCSEMALYKATMMSVFDKAESGEHMTFSRD